MFHSTVKKGLCVVSVETSRHETLCSLPHNMTLDNSARISCGRINVKIEAGVASQ